MIQERSSTAFDSEKLIAYEVGYRVKPVNNVTIDNTAFINDYQKLSTLEPGALDGFYSPYYFSNLGKGKAYGFETSDHLGRNIHLEPESELQLHQHGAR